MICDPSAGTAGFLVSAGNTYTRNILIGFMKNRLEHYNSDMFTVGLV
jgi:hypothetical protein